MILYRKIRPFSSLGFEPYPLLGSVFFSMSTKNIATIFEVLTENDMTELIVQYRFDARIPEYGPDAAVQIIEQDNGIEAIAGNTTLVSVLDGTVSGKAEKLKVNGVDGRTSAYVLDGQIYLRTPLKLLSPAWSSSIASGDGMTVYQVPDTPVILLSDKGKLVRASILEDSEL